MSNDCRGGEEALAERGAAGVLDVGDDLVVEQRAELDEVAVGVDDRMVDLAADPGRLRWASSSSAAPLAVRVAGGTLRAGLTGAP